jgi:hypothetical protein
MCRLQGDDAWRSLAGILQRCSLAARPGAPEIPRSARQMLARLLQKARYFGLIVHRREIGDLLVEELNTALPPAALEGRRPAIVEDEDFARIAPRGVRGHRAVGLEPSEPRDIGQRLGRPRCDGRTIDRRRRRCMVRAITSPVAG